MDGWPEGNIATVKEREITIERWLIGDIVDQQYTHGSTVVSWKVEKKLLQKNYDWTTKLSKENCNGIKKINK